MVQIFMVFLGAVYLLFAGYFFKGWVQLYKQDTKMSAEEKQLSRVILAIATVLWPVVVPISYAEKLSKAKNAAQPHTKKVPYGG
jgi:uncharacterized membrane protein